jgi:hypothetical protein
MISRQLRYVVLSAGAVLNLLCMRPAAAALGGDAASVLADAHELQGTAHSILLTQYVLHEINTDSGMRVREFLNQDGIVFAVAWSGPVVPGLKGLLGPRFAAYSHALAALQQPGLHRSLRITSEDLVVELGGHLRAYSGRAFLPALIPSGVQTADLR